VVHPASSCGYWEEGKTGWTVGAVAPPSAPDEGVAIATALMPPVCTVGIGLAKADPAAASGVLLLFLSNFAAISAAAAGVFYFIGFRAERNTRGNGPLPRGFLISGVLLLGVALPLASITTRTIAEAREQRAI